MDDFFTLLHPDQTSITCVETHTTGEPTRIVISGYPDLTSNTTLLEQRTEAKARHDHIRRRLMLEPRGHADMYGAILRPDTELVRNAGPAHIGVLFMHNEGYSTMCGHATIALGRILLDTHDQSIFPRREEVPIDQATGTATLHLHAPCGLIHVTVPVTRDGSRSDPTRPVSFISVPSFATGRNVNIRVPPALRWPELGAREAVRVAFAYGGAFTCLVDAEELGFGDNGLGQPVDVEAYNRASKALKTAIAEDSEGLYRRYFRHPVESDLGFLYTVMVVDKTLGKPEKGSNGAETGLCFFADQQIDRSPTGSIVAARVAYAYATGELTMGQARTYHSLVSNSTEGGTGGFVGSVVEEVPALYNNEQLLGPVVRVKIEGYAYYTGYHVFVVEKEDALGDGGFLFTRLG